MPDSIPLRRLPNPLQPARTDAGLEWLVTNGVGGYASGAVSGAMTRRYHGALVAALPAPWGRMVMLSHVETVALIEDKRVLLDSGFADPSAASIASIAEFRLEWGLPIWTYESDGVRIEKRILMPHRQNTVHVSFIATSGHATIALRPFVHFRHYEDALSDASVPPCVLTSSGGAIDLNSGEFPTLRLAVHGRHAVLTLDSADVVSRYVEEEHRGYAHCGRIWSPGFFQFDLASGDDNATLIASTEPWEIVNALAPDHARQAELARRRRLIEQAVPQAQRGVPAELVLAADQFVIAPIGRSEDAARAIAAGTEARTVIAGYHWFTDWGRDTMVSLEGLTLLTGRHDDAAFILRTFASYVRDGLIPNMFPDGEREGLYHTADATLWFFHAIDRYVHTTGDRSLLSSLLPTLEDIIEHHVRGTRFGIGVDSSDGLLRQGAPGYQLTWMDAKVDDWVVTPRRGKAVEINALFYNALRLMEEWTREDPGRQASKYRSLADRLHASFNQRFWNEKSECLYDVVDGENPAADVACRPNQIFSISLPHAVLSQDRWRAVVEVVRARLLTPYGLRSLSPESPDYRPQYYGDLRARDAAYHQGTVWAWLIGPFADAWRRAAPHEGREVDNMLNAFAHHLSEAGVGSVSEIFDAESPFTPRGCIAQAWSVAELLRVWSTPD